MLSYLKLGLKSICLVLLPFTDCFSQVLRLDNGLLTVNNLSFIYIDGSVESNLSSVFQINGNDNMDDGIVTVNGDFLNNSDFQLNGKLKLYGNWFNNSSFQSSTGHLFLEGHIQELGGNQVSNFHHLTLNGSGFKFQSNHQSCSGILNLNTLELRTETFQFSVHNPNVNAIQRSEISPTSGGIVSSLNGGFLNRATNSNNSYLFPVGSTFPIYRYRPVLIQPSNANTSFYNVRFAPVEATSESFNLSQTLEPFCELNANYYHQIGSSSNIPITLLIATISNEDGVWNGLSRWQQEVGEGWSKIQGTSSQNQSPFEWHTITNWNNFSAIPYILHRNAPEAIINGTYTICEGENVQIPISFSGEAPYIVNFENDSGESFSQQFSSSTGELTLSPTSNTTYTVVSVSDNNCTNENLDNNTANVQVTQLPEIVASPSTTSGYAPLSVTFSNSSNQAQSFNWIFGNGDNSTLAEPSTVYEQEGIYNVTLIAENAGCFAEQFWTINVEQSPLEIFVPNVFSVNDDDINDLWGIEVKGALAVEVFIINRWGNIMMELNGINEKWDGYVKDKKATDGVYFYQYRIIDLNNNKHIGHGHFTLISN